MQFYGIVYDVGYQTFVQWASEFNSTNPYLIAEARSNCVVIYKKV
jgi:hypothetical protein